MSYPITLKAVLIISEVAPQYSRGSLNMAVLVPFRGCIPTFKGSWSGIHRQNQVGSYPSRSLFSGCVMIYSQSECKALP